MFFSLCISEVRHVRELFHEGRTLLRAVDHLRLVDRALAGRRAQQPVRVHQA